MLKTSGISKDKVMENPDLVLDVLNFHDQYNKQLEQRVAKPMPGTFHNYFYSDIYLSISPSISYSLHSALSLFDILLLHTVAPRNQDPRNQGPRPQAPQQQRQQPQQHHNNHQPQPSNYDENSDSMPVADLPEDRPVNLRK